MSQRIDEQQTGATVRRPGTAPATWALGSLFERLLTGADSGHALEVSMVTQPPGNATPLHLHSNEAEAFYLISGAMTYQAGPQTYRLTGGDFLYLPPGVPHAMRITGTEPISFLAITAPAGLMDLYDEVGRPASERRLPDADPQRLGAEIAAWNRMSSNFGIEILGPPLAAVD